MHDLGSAYAAYRVTIPSQIRFTHYYGALLANPTLQAHCYQVSYLIDDTA